VKLFSCSPSPQCISEYLLILSSTFWYPSHVGSMKVSQQRFGDPNGFWASSWWTHHPTSTKTIWRSPIAQRYIVDQVWLRRVTVWTILTKMSFFSTCIANFVLDVAWWIVLIAFNYFPLQVLFLSSLETFVWPEVPLWFQNRNFRVCLTCLGKLQFCVPFCSSQNIFFWQGFFVSWRGSAGLLSWLSTLRHNVPCWSICST